MSLLQRSVHLTQPLIQNNHLYPQVVLLHMLTLHKRQMIQWTFTSSHHNLHMVGTYVFLCCVLLICTLSTFLFPMTKDRACMEAHSNELWYTLSEFAVAEMTPRKARILVYCATHPLLRESFYFQKQ